MKNYIKNVKLDTGCNEIHIQWIFLILKFAKPFLERNRKHYEIISQWEIEKTFVKCFLALKKKVEGPDVNIECCWYNNGIILYQFKEQKMLLSSRVLYWKEWNLSSFL